ncbi:g6653 [Coccomyxa elongata]
MQQPESHDTDDDWETDSGDEVEEEQATKCLFSEDVLPSATAALEHDATHFGFDFAQYVKQAKLDDYGVIKCINYIRAVVKQGSDPRSDLAGSLGTPEKPWDDDKYLFPVLQNDGLLCHEFDTSLVAMQQTTSKLPSPLKSVPDASADLEQLRQENAALRAAFQQACLADMAPEVANEIQGGGGLDALEGMELCESRDMRINGEVSSSGARPGHISVRPRGGHPRSMQEARVDRADESYFESYGYFDIHRTMISDKVRMDAYQRALECNPSLIKGASVLDVGCGTGILSMFAARGGAAQVIAVEGSKRMAEHAHSIVAENRLDSASGGPITVVSARMEDIASLPVAQVDVIVSEWMGYALFFECMLDSVVLARDRWLKPGGAMLPDLASIYMAAAGAGALDLDFWDNVYDFVYRPVKSLLLDASLKDAIVAQVDARHLVTAPCCLRSFDLATMSAADADFTTDFVLEAAASETGPAAECHALVLWFDTEFSGRFCKEQPAVLSTSPHSTQTHWAQTILTLRQPIALQAPAEAGLAAAGAGPADAAAAALRGRISFGRSDKHRCLDISLECQAFSAHGAPVGPLQTQLYSIATAGS